MKAAAAASNYDISVFINCPFDDEYQPLFRAAVFAVFDCGFIPRCALEVYDSGQVRIDKIAKIIAECRLGIHDISRTELDPAHKLPRFNMPLELGMFLGAQRFGSGRQKAKNCLIFDIERYRYQKFISDIAGQDISAHDATTATLIAKFAIGCAQPPAVEPFPAARPSRAASKPSRPLYPPSAPKSALSPRNSPSAIMRTLQWSGCAVTSCVNRKAMRAAYEYHGTG